MMTLALFVPLMVHAGAMAQVSEELEAPALPPVAAPAPSAQPIGPAQPLILGGPGESCRARSDCEASLRCLSNVCRDPLEGTTCQTSAECGPHLRCYERMCRSPMERFATEQAAEPRAAGSARRRTIDGVRPFIGLTLMSGPSISYNSMVAMAAALRFGLYAGVHEFAIELAPFSLYDFNIPVFQVNASYAILIPMSRGSGAALYWPIRLGIGAIADTSRGTVFVEARGDFLGLAVQIDQVMLDFHLPSLRFAWSPGYVSGYGSLSSSVIMTWFGGVGVSYMF